ncbi:hypothetical protein CROQUDRAFT_665903 [Cronartium quercuum f. sp. fusiforme G11]|uniref:Uncharacterized protein n=1 Tax=Cronartium quercuum f. sp. fusiforme G11 TaxID=708437 RepID=A0A9P6T6Y2_9BASI|nr:hypothetical protein CROQUDRAFT_665903 [Cronartium quercuum f. sp. fusiforme G11]
MCLVPMHVPAFYHYLLIVFMYVSMFYLSFVYTTSYYIPVLYLTTLPPLHSRSDHILPLPLLHYTLHHHHLLTLF